MGFKNVITLLFLIAAVALMLKLGEWQLQRLEWKEAIIADIQAQEATDPMQTPLDLDDNPSRFERGYIEGFLSGGEPVYIKPRTLDGKVGSHALLPFQVEGGPAIIVNLGWLSDNDETTIPTRLPNKIAGYLKAPETKGSFTPDNNPNENRWYWADLNALASHFTIYQDVYPMILYLEKPVIGNINPHQGLPLPRNKHAQYATFWFGMAGLLIFLSGFYIWRQRKK